MREEMIAAARDALGVGSLWIGDDHILTIAKAIVAKLRESGIEVPDFEVGDKPEQGTQTCMEI